MKQALAKIILTLRFDYDEDEETTEVIREKLTQIMSDVIAQQVFDDYIWDYPHDLDITVVEVNETPL